MNVHPKRSWEAWWEKEQEHLRHSGKCVIIAEIILALRFLICQCGLFDHLIIVKHANSVLIVSNCQQRGKAELLIFIHLIVGFLLLVVTFITPTYVSLQDIMACILASLQMGWGMILIAQACEPLIFKLGIWGAVKTLAHGYEIIMGFFLFAPVAFLAWFSYVSELQTHILFIPAFIRGLQIWRILGRPVKETITVF
ncbi:callose synthase 3-like [Eucalyptus grandis]|uniref:callose synthase 3-like n=1 Tax=Eucalyptus grandis TaxID=71139 RepID=UPI00192ECD04|nr:callose synthase 3-like [Eucalyptus grandis]